MPGRPAAVKVNLKTNPRQAAPLLRQPPG